MWYEIFTFEIQYRAKRLDTYLFFVLLFLFSLIAFDFIFEGMNLGMVKENAPYIIARIMAIVSGIFMVLTSMIMGVPVLRDFEHNIESLLFVNPIKKRDYLWGRFLGSFVVLVFIFSAVIWGIILGEMLPWRNPDNLLPFTLWTYLQPFLTIVMPTLFFGSCLFFVSGTLSRNLIVVYTQGILFFVVFIFSRQIEDPFLSSLVEPFSFTAIAELVQSWSIADRNNLMVPIEGVLLYNRLIWVGIGIIALIFGYMKFDFQVIKDKENKQKGVGKWEEKQFIQEELSFPEIRLETSLTSSLIQLISHSTFYLKSILKEVSFWSIVICGMAIIFINSISLGSAYGVNSYPTTYLIVEELQEMSLYFFLIILVFYSGELIWKERGANLDLIYDALPVSDFIHLLGKFIGLLLVYVVLLLSLIFSGVLFQTLSGYFQYKWGIYFSGFFLEIFPFLVLYTFISFFFHVMANSKFAGHACVLIFFLFTMALEVFGFAHVLYKFGGNKLEAYSDMNGYGHFLEAYAWGKLYWLAFSILLFILTVVFMIRGKETQLKFRIKLAKQRLSKSLLNLGVAAFMFFIGIGAYIYYNTNILNSHWSSSKEEVFRADYEKTLKHFEYVAQPKIVDVNLTVELYPKTRNYTAEGVYILKNTEAQALSEIHIQKLIDDQVSLEYVRIEGGTQRQDPYNRFDFYTYELDQALAPGDSLIMEFKQIFTTQGFVESNSNTSILNNGTFFSNKDFPSLGYNKKYELREEEERADYGLAPRISMAKRDDVQELRYGKTGGDGDEINFEILIGTDSSQTAIAPGYLQKSWTESSRRYFHYKMDKPMINFYTIVSARYERMKDIWIPKADSLGGPVDLEIYYHKGHDYNLDRMMESMKMSFAYYSKNFSPYQYRQMRIMEFPRYQSFAQSFPNTVPFSESIGFMLDIDDEEDVDMSFYITAHELAHQWWGLQVLAANVEGRFMILESLAQYSALMVLQQRYPKEKVQQFLRRELDTYLKGRIAEKDQEMPLELVGKQRYIYYRKGVLNLYAFQDYISEEKVNLALRRFVADWNSFDNLEKTDRYATTADLLGYFREVTPDSLQYVIEDLFETITLYENKTSKAGFEALGSGYKVSLGIEVNKYRIDSLSNEIPIDLEDWINVGIYAEGSDGKEELIYLKKHKITSRESEIEITIDQKPSKAGIDPLNKLIDKDIRNNVKALREKEEP